jgi:aminoglycoside phosphotransferase
MTKSSRKVANKMVAYENFFKKWPTQFVVHIGDRGLPTFLIEQYHIVGVQDLDMVGLIDIVILRWMSFTSRYRLRAFGPQIKIFWGSWSMF